MVITLQLGPQGSIEFARNTTRLLTKIVVSALCAPVFAAGQQLCDVIEHPERWKDKQVSLHVKLPPFRHGSPLIPASENYGYHGKCLIEPIFSGTPEFLNRGVKAEPSSPAMNETMRAYYIHMRSEGFRYNKELGKGNGFGYRGYAPVALVAQGFTKTPCEAVGK
jgi:hypothetical protein